MKTPVTMPGRKSAPVGPVMPRLFLIDSAVMTPQNIAPAMDFETRTAPSGFLPGIMSPSNVETTVPPSMAPAMTARW